MSCNIDTITSGRSAQGCLAKIVLEHFDASKDVRSTTCATHDTDVMQVTSIFFWRWIINDIYVHFNENVFGVTGRCQGHHTSSSSSWTHSFSVLQCRPSQFSMSMIMLETMISWVAYLNKEHEHVWCTYLHSCFRSSMHITSFKHNASIEWNLQWDDVVTMKEMSGRWETGEKTSAIDPSV